MKKAKPKTALATVRGKKAPGARKPKKTKIKKREVWQWSCETSQWPKDPIPETYSPHTEGGLTYKQKRFIDFYIDGTGNATEAYARAFPHVTRASAKSLAVEMMSKEHIIDAIESKREEFRILLAVNREKILRVQTAMAMATIDEFVDVFNRPGDVDSYRNLGENIHALKSVKSGEFGNEIQMIDKQAALNELWKKLGFQTGADSNRERDVTDSALNRALTILKGGKTE